MKEIDIPKSRILAIDVGSVRLGLALWKPDSGLSECLPYRKRKKLTEDLKFLENLVEKHSIEAFLVGIPLSLSGKRTQSTKNAEFWVNTLKSHFQIPVFSIDESFSTKEALKLLKDRSGTKKMELKDSLSAALFLEEFIRAQTQKS